MLARTKLRDLQDRRFQNLVLQALTIVIGELRFGRSDSKTVEDWLLACSNFLLDDDKIHELED